MIKYVSARPAAPLQYFWINDNKGLCITRQPVRVHGSQPTTHPNDIYMGPPIYRPGIDMGEIDAMSRMRDDELRRCAPASPRIPKYTSPARQ